VRALRLLLTATVAPAIVAAAAACGTVRGAYDACDAPDDCILPFVCCTAPRIPQYDQKIPYCERLEYCDGFLPFLVEGNPCHRYPGVPQQECASGLECCPESLLCGPTGSCTGMVPTPTGPSSQAECVADGECPAGEVCCGIDFTYREDGTCKWVSECTPPTM
jgi:hypothetical protein